MGDTPHIDKSSVVVERGELLSAELVLLIRVVAVHAFADRAGGADQRVARLGLVGQQPAAGLEHTDKLRHRGGHVVEVVQDADHDDRVEGLAQVELFDVRGLETCVRDGVVLPRALNQLVRIVDAEEASKAAFEVAGREPRAAAGLEDRGLGGQRCRRECAQKPLPPGDGGRRVQVFVGLALGDRIEQCLVATLAVVVFEGVGRGLDHGVGSARAIDSGKTSVRV